MKKYNTEPIDFTGCHPVIAEHLKRGEAIDCKVWDDGHSHEEVRCVVGYWSDTYVSEGIVEWDHAEPIPVKVKSKRVMPPERAIPVLIAEGWRFTSTGFLTGPDCVLEPEVYARVLAPQMYALMGKDLDGEAGEFAWPDCIIEEVDE